MTHVWQPRAGDLLTAVSPIERSVFAPRVGPSLADAAEAAILRRAFGPRESAGPGDDAARVVFQRAFGPRERAGSIVDERTRLGLGTFATKSSLTQTKGAIQIDLGHRAVFGAAAGTPTLAVADASVLSDSGDADGHVVGKTASDGNLSWIAFAFQVPPDLKATASCDVCIHGRLGGAPSAGDKVEFGFTYRSVTRDEAMASAGSSESSSQALTVTGYSSGDDVYIKITGAISANMLTAEVDYVKGVVSRDAQAGNANDTFAGSVAFLGAMLIYTKTELT